MLYHRVLAPRIDSRLLCVSPDRFDQQMSYIKNHYFVYSYKNFIEDLKKGEFRKKSVFITFDDGYADNYAYAYKILKKYEIPAVMFITGNRERRDESWITKLENYFFVVKKQPSQICLNIGKKKYSFSLKNSTDKQTSFLIILELLKRSVSDIQQSVLSQIGKQIKVKIRPRMLYRSLSKSEIRKMSLSGLIEIGGHTVDHIKLSAFDYKDQREEILKNKKYLESIIHKPVQTFSYPYGGEKDFNLNSLKIAKKYFESAFSNIPSKIHNKTDYHQIPRFLIRNWKIDEFREKLATFSTLGVWI